MPKDIVLDASVVIAAVSPSEVHHESSLRLCEALHEIGIVVVVPAPFLLEIYAAMIRTPREIRKLGFAGEENPIYLRLVSVGSAEVHQMIEWATVNLPGKSPTRGADLAYIGVARTSGLPLVSVDGGLHKFKYVGVEIYYPSEMLEIWGMA